MAGTLFPIYKHFGDFVKCIFQFCCKFSMKIIFYLSVNTDGMCLYDCYTYSKHFVFRKCLEMRRHLGSGRKTVNSQGYSELREPIKTHENCYSLIWWKLNSFICMTINLSDLDSMCKIQKNSYFQTKSERLVFTHIKEYIISRHYERGL